MEATDQKIIEGANFSATNVGNIIGLQGKVFLKESIGSTGTEISITSLAPGTEIPLLHFHKKNEEVYIILTGEGDFQVDGNVFPIRSGSVVRVAPAGKRSMRNTSGEPMQYICIQSKAGSLEETTHNDGVMVREALTW